MNIDEMTYGDLKKIAAMFAPSNANFDNGMIGKYVVVRCRDAGVHAGVLVSTNGRECLLKDARRLWYWKVRKGSSDFLNGIALSGVHADSKIGAPVEIHLTENCEIIKASDEAEKSIREHPVYAK